MEAKTISFKGARITPLLRQRKNITQRQTRSQSSRLLALSGLTRKSGLRARDCPWGRGRSRDLRRGQAWRCWGLVVRRGTVLVAGRNQAGCVAASHKGMLFCTRRRRGCGTRGARVGCRCHSAKGAVRGGSWQFFRDGGRLAWLCAGVFGDEGGDRARGKTVGKGTGGSSEVEGWALLRLVAEIGRWRFVEVQRWLLHGLEQWGAALFWRRAGGSARGGGCVAEGNRARELMRM